MAFIRYIGDLLTHYVGFTRSTGVSAPPPAETGMQDTKGTYLLDTAGRYILDTTGI